MAAPAKPGLKRKLAPRAPRPDAIDRAVSEAVRKARRRAFAEGLAVPVQRWNDATVRWVKR
jgi:hypothetical protein